MLKVTVVVDNVVGYSSPVGMRGEHGWSLLLECDGKKILYDTGESSLVVDNLCILGIHPKEVDAVVLSHGHSDHTGGLESVLRCAKKKMPVFAHPDVFAEKVGRSDRGMDFIGIKHKKILLDSLGAEWCLMREPYEISKSLWLSGEVERTTAYELGDEELCVLSSGAEVTYDIAEENILRDPLFDDMSLYYKSQKGLLVISGCAHAGIINVVKQGFKLTDTELLQGIIGGTHLGAVSEEQKTATINDLLVLAPGMIAAGHCTDQEVQAEIRNKFGKDVCCFSHVGWSWSC